MSYLYSLSNYLSSITKECTYEYDKTKQIHIVILSFGDLDSGDPRKLAIFLPIIFYALIPGVLPRFW